MFTRIKEKLCIIYAVLIADKYAFYSVRKNRAVGNGRRLYGDACFTSENADRWFIELINKYNEQFILNKEEQETREHAENNT